MSQVNRHRRRCYDQKYTVDGLKVSIARDDYHHQGSLPNNFMRTLPAAEKETEPDRPASFVVTLYVLMN
ncbi:MAG: hypothetical protein ACSW8G_08620, partial [Bacillota bacterium]